MRTPNFRRLVAATVLGLLVEVVLLVGAVLQPWGNTIVNLSQEPAYHLVIWIERFQHPGLAGQAAYTTLMLLLQWVIWSAVSYWWLAHRNNGKTAMQPQSHPLAGTPQRKE